MQLYFFRRRAEPRVINQNHTLQLTSPTAREVRYVQVVSRMTCLLHGIAIEGDDTGLVRNMVSPVSGRRRRRYTS